MSNDLMRISGINSGYDTESMIEAMMSAYQTKIDTQQKKLTKLTWQQEAYRDVTDKLTTFKNKYFDILKRDSYLMSPSTFNKFSAKVNGKDAAESGIKVSTTSKTLTGDYSIKAKSLASAAKAAGGSLTPSSFALDLTKAAAGSDYTTTTAEDGTVTRGYSFALDVQVGSVTKTIDFNVSVAETDGQIDRTAFNEAALKALNDNLRQAFGLSGRSGAVATGKTDDAGNEWFLQAELDGDKLKFVAGGNAAATVTEKTGYFGLSKASQTIGFSALSVVTGENSVAVQVGDKIKNVKYNGVSANYYATKDLEGNEGILAEYNSLKAAAYRRANHLSEDASISADALNNYVYTAEQAAKDKNTAAITDALNSAFADEGVTFSTVGSTMLARQGGKNVEFNLTATSGGTLGIAKGSASNKYSGSTSLSDLGIGSGSFTINGKTISVGGSTTIDSLIDAVNKSGAGVKMEFSALTNSFIITSENMGTGENITVSGDADITKALGLTDDNGDLIGYTAGQNAVFEINGQEVYHNSNSYTMDGTTFTVDDSIELDKTYNINISKSYDDVKQLIKDFVKDYNQLIDDVYGYTATSPKRDSSNNLYEPLTDAEKEEMSDDEIEKWEGLAKQGVIYNDSTVNGIMSKMRMVLYNSVTLDDGTKFGIYGMGIKTSSEYSDHGKLEIDEDAFDKAFNADPEAITKLFTDGESGIMQQVKGVLEDAVRTTTDVKGSLIRKAGLKSGSTATDNFIYKEMQKVNDRIKTLQDRYDAKEEYWWKVFTNMESAMSKLNSQTSYLSSYLGGTGNYQ